jgi:5-methylcytosine-specific restriction protein A
MPSALKRVCAGCRRPVLGRCEACSKRKYKSQDERRGTAASRGYDADWRRVRSLKLINNPLCEDCEEQGRVRVAQEVHHIRTIAARPDLRLSMSNLMSLCKPCHSRRTMNESVKATT